MKRRASRRTVPPYSRLALSPPLRERGNFQEFECVQKVHPRTNVTFYRSSVTTNNKKKNTPHYSTISSTPQTNPHPVKTPNCTLKATQAIIAAHTPTSGHLLTLRSAPTRRWQASYFALFMPIWPIVTHAWCGKPTMVLLRVW